MLNDGLMQVSKTTSMEGSLMATGFPYYDFVQMPQYIEVLKVLMKETHGLRRMGSAAIDLCWVASGRFDAYFEHKLEAWDSAAGSLIVQEAGGKVTDYSGNPFSVYQKQMLASNGKVHDDILRVLNGGEV